MKYDIKKAEPIDMAKYNDSEEIADMCKGCNKVFEHIFTPEESEIAVFADKCLAYIRPEAKWPAKDQKFAMATFKVREVNVSGKTAMVEKELPINDKYCPLASHFTPELRIKVEEKVRAGQQRHA